MSILQAVLMVTCYGLLNGGLQVPSGIPLSESITGFIREVAPPVAGFVGLLELVVFLVIVVCCFGHWCLIQATLNPDKSLLSRVRRFISSRVTLALSPNSLCRILPPAFVGRLILRAQSRPLPSTPAGLAGAAPLLL